ncbi:hypothetical protein B0T13DRAFT_400988, partial [Neurospora crassa]
FGGGHRWRRWPPWEKQWRLVGNNGVRSAASVVGIIGFDTEEPWSWTWRRTGRSGIWRSGVSSSRWWWWWWEIESKGVDAVSILVTRLPLFSACLPACLFLALRVPAWVRFCLVKPKV